MGNVIRFSLPLLALILPLTAPAASSYAEQMIQDVIADKEQVGRRIARPDQSRRPFVLSKGSGGPSMPVVLKTKTTYPYTNEKGEFKLGPVKMVFVDWGDGSPVIKASAGMPLEHVYGGSSGPSESTKYKGRITFLVESVSGRGIDLRFTEAFDYNVWVTAADAQSGDPEGGRNNPYYGSEPVECDTYSVSDSCTDFVPQDGIYKVFNTHEQKRTGAWPEENAPFSCLRIDFYNNAFQATASNEWHSIPQWMNTQCGSEQWFGMDGQTVTRSDDDPANLAPAELEEILAACQDEREESVLWLNNNPKPDPVEDEEGNLVDPETPAELEEREYHEEFSQLECVLDEIELEVENVDGFDTANNSFHKSYYKRERKRRRKRHGGSLRSKKTYEYYADFYVQWLRFDKQLLLNICLDNNPSRIELKRNGQVLASAGCEENWVLNVPEEYRNLGRNEELEIGLHWKPSPYHVPHTPNMPAGGHVEEEGQQKWWQSHGSDYAY